MSIRSLKCNFDYFVCILKLHLFFYLILSYCKTGLVNDTNYYQTIHSLSFNDKSNGISLLIHNRCTVNNVRTNIIANCNTIEITLMKNN